MYWKIFSQWFQHNLAIYDYINCYPYISFYTCICCFCFVSINSLIDHFYLNQYQLNISALWTDISAGVNYFIKNKIG